MDSQENGMMSTKQAWGFVPTGYFMEGLPFVMIIIASTVMYKNFGFTNAQITMYTGSLMLPWGLKPLWSWLVDVTKTKRWWIYTMEILMALSYIGVVFTIQTAHETNGSAMFFFKSSIAVFWAMAFFSSTHDISVDGFYLVSLSNSQQSYFVGMQRLFYQLAKFFVTAFILILVGKESEKFGMVHAWTTALIITGVVTLIIGIYHAFYLPRKEIKVNSSSEFKNVLREWPILIAIILLLLYKFLPYPIIMILIGFSLLIWRIIAITIRSKKVKTVGINESSGGVFSEFFQLEGIWTCILFIFTFRLGENFVSKIVTLFLLDSRSEGGLGLTTTFIGYSYTFVLIAILLAGSLGGLYIYRKGIKKVLWIMYALVNVPHLIYIYLAYTQPKSIVIIICCQMLENFAVTFALAAFTMVLFYTVRNSRFKTSHFAFLSAINIVALMLPSMYSGPLQMFLGYKHFFVFVQIMMIPSLAVIPFLKIDSEFGKSTKKDKSIWILLSVIIIATILIIIINHFILK